MDRLGAWCWRRRQGRALRFFEWLFRSLGPPLSTAEALILWSHDLRGHDRSGKATEAWEKPHHCERQPKLWSIAIVQQRAACLAKMMTGKAVIRKSKGEPCTGSSSYVGRTFVCS